MNKWEENQVGNFEVFLEDFDAIEAKTAGNLRYHLKRFGYPEHKE